MPLQKTPIFLISGAEHFGPRCDDRLLDFNEDIGLPYGGWTVSRPGWATFLLVRATDDATIPHARNPNISTTPLDFNYLCSAGPRTEAEVKLKAKESCLSASRHYDS